MNENQIYTDVQSHKVQRTIKEIVIYPDHADRTESPEFRKSKEILKKDGHDSCFICGCKENIQYHHFGCEWALANDCDFDKLKNFLLLFDVYGYSKLMKDKPITTPDDIRNLIALCEKHHIKSETGIHEMTFPIWISQLISKTGCNPVPDQLSTLLKERDEKECFWSKLKMIFMK